MTALLSTRQSLRTLTLLSLLLAVARPALPQDRDKADACNALPEAAVPEQDRPTIADMRSLGISGGCSADDLYYQDNSPDHFRKARLCVLAKLGLFRTGTNPEQAKIAQRAVAGDSLDDMDGLVLAMLYTNGEDVQRNLPLARKWICNSAGGGTGPWTLSPDQQLEDLNRIVKSGEHYGICKDDNDPGFGRVVDAYCLGMQGQKTMSDIQKEEAAINTSLPSNFKASFQALQTAWHGFYPATLKMENCEDGWGCEEMNLTYSLDRMNDWLALLKAIHQNGPAPAAGAKASSFSQLDRQLNLAYPDLTQIDPSIRTADRAWLKYRDAWVRFGTLRWPAVTADQWRAWQTAEWIKLMQE